MKPFDQITINRRLSSIRTSPDGMSAVISMPAWQGSVIASTGAGWEHVSVCPFQKRITPTWDDMCRLKDMFFEDDEAVIQIHPVKADYVNNMSNCLHLWKCTYKDMVLPPSILVGVRRGQSREEIKREIKVAYEMAGEKI